MTPGADAFGGEDDEDDDDDDDDDALSSMDEMIPCPPDADRTRFFLIFAINPETS